MVLHGVQPPHPPPPPPPNFKDLLNEKRYKKKRKIPTNIFRGLRVL